MVQVRRRHQLQEPALLRRIPCPSERLEQRQPRDAGRRHRRRQPEGSPVNPNDPKEIQEFVDHSWFTYSNEGKDTKDLGLYPFDGETVPHFELPKGSVGTKTKFSWLGGDGKYSWIKTPKWKGHTMEVGPLARVVVGYALGKEVYKEPVDALLKEMNLPLEARPYGCPRYRRGRGC